MGSFTTSKWHALRKRAYTWYQTLVFWERHQALYYAIGLLSGTVLKMGVYLPLLIGLTQPNKVRLVGFYLLVVAAFFRLEFIENPPFPKGDLYGNGYLTIDKIYRLQVKNTEVINYHATLSVFQIQDKEYRDLPCFISFAKDQPYPLANQDYLVQGRLQPKRYSNSFYVSSIKPVPGTWNFSQMRFNWKDRVRKYIKSWVTNKESSEFFCTLATGDIESTMMKYMFNQSGLSHTLAISGFHYTWLAIVITMFLQLFLSRYVTSYVMIILAALYFFLMGVSPSMHRAWLAITISFIAYIVGRNNAPLNALGLAILIALTIDPKAANSLGFQFSFGATFAILTWMEPILHFLRKIWPKRSKRQIATFPKFYRMVILLTNYFTSAIALTLCVNLFVFPLTLLMMEEYSLWGLWYNLLFPALITITMLMLLIGICLWGTVGGWILKIAGWYTTPLMWWVYCGRGALDGMLRLSLPFWIVEVWLVGITLIGFWLEDRRYRLTIIKNSV